MLPASQDRAYQDFLTLLTEFTQAVAIAEQNGIFEPIYKEFDRLSGYFKTEIASISDRHIDPAHVSRWQSVQTEILRAFKLLSTDLLFLASARQGVTKSKRIKSIKQRQNQLIGYCQIMLKNNN